MVISKKKKREIQDILGTAFSKTVDEHLPKDEIAHPPDQWYEDTTEKWDMLMDFQQHVSNGLDSLFQTKIKKKSS